METGKVSDLDFDKLGEEYGRQSEGGSDGKTKSSTIHKALDKNKDTSHKVSRRSRTETKLVKKGKVIKEYKNGVLRKFKLQKGFDTDKFIAGSSAAATVMDMLRTVQG